MSEGEFVNMRPHIDNKRGTQIDESSDTYDTIDWLVKNVPRNNSRVGMYGISYPAITHPLVPLIRIRPWWRFTTSAHRGLVLR